MTAFRHGVAAGDPSPDGAVIWARVTSEGPVRLRWKVARDPELCDVAASGEEVAEAGTDHCVSVTVGGLEAATEYWYRFSAGPGTSPTGRFKTAPDGPVEHLRFGVVCCGNWATGFFNAYGALARRDLDAVIHVGDAIYEDEAEHAHGVRLHQPPGRVATLAGYRARYAQYRGDPDLSALLARHAVVAVWDDHEIAGNAWSGGAARHDPAVDGDWVARREAAVRAWNEWTPVRLPEPGRPDRLWRSVSFGGLAELMMLDTRLAGRDRPAAQHRAVVGVARKDRSLLGPSQRAWAAARLTSPGAQWRLVASQVMMAPVGALRVPGALGRPAGAVRGLVGLNPGQWDGYPQERETLLGAMGACPDDVVVLSGDLHSSWACDLRAADGTPVAFEATTPAVSAPSFAGALLPSVPGLARLAARWFSAQNHHVRWCDLAGHGYLLVDVTAERLTFEWWHVDPVRKRHRGERLAARVAVDRGGRAGYLLLV